jgi:Spy/CpxP family protein refolding chaperone
MKKLSILAVTLLLLLPGIHAVAQNTDEELQLVREQWGVDKKQLIMQYMKFNEAESKAFWPVYDAYMKEHKLLVDARIALIKDYAKNYTSISNAKATELTNKTIDNDMAISKLQKDYFAKFAKAVTPLRASQYMQVEYYLQNTIKSMIQDEIPFIGELEKAKKELKNQ